jgi:hypothetical protein
MSLFLKYYEFRSAFFCDIAACSGNYLPSFRENPIGSTFNGQEMQENQIT